MEKTDRESLAPAGGYVEYAPPPNLARAVASFWEIRIPTSGDARVRILPNACVDIVVYVSDPSVGDGIATVVAPPHRSYVVGSTLRSFIVRSVGWRHVVGASLLPAGVEPLLGASAREIGESVALLHDVIGRDAVELEDLVIEGPTERAVQRLAEVLSRFQSRRAEGNAVVDGAVRFVRDGLGTKRIDDVANAINVSTRRLERNFLEHVGMTAKTFSRLVRFDRAARDIATRGTTPWSRFALDHGYSDQAHFVNEFSEFAGISPTQFELEQRELQ